MLITLLLAALFATIIVGLTFVGLGTRGKRLNDHPVCRACTFDLENIYPARSMCPECGTSLESPHAVQIGQRQRRPVFVVGGLLLIVAALAPITGLTWAAASGKNLNTFKPLSVLLWEARRETRKEAKAIASEIMDRMIAGTLDASQEKQVAQLALDRQESPDIPWDDLWGDLFERARFNGNASKDDLQRFLRNAAVPRLVARPRIAAAANIPIAVKADLRIGSTTQAIINVWLESASIDKIPVSRVPGSGGSSFPPALFTGDSGPLATVMAIGPRGTTGLSMGAGPSVCEIASADLPLGLHNLEVQVIVTASQWDSTGKGIMDAMSKPKATSNKASTWTLKAPIEFAPPDQAAIAQVSPTPALEAALRSKLTPNYTMLYPAPMGNKPRLGLNFSIVDLPTPVAFEVFARAGDKTVKVGEFTSGSAANPRDLYSMTIDPTARSVTGPSLGSKVNMVDLILKPSTELARKTTDITSIYGGEVVIKSVAINTDSLNRANALRPPPPAQDPEPSEKPKKKTSWGFKGVLPW